MISQPFVLPLITNDDTSDITLVKSVRVLSYLEDSTDSLLSKINEKLHVQKGRVNELKDRINNIQNHINKINSQSNPYISISHPLNFVSTSDPPMYAALTNSFNKPSICEKVKSFQSQNHIPQNKSKEAVFININDSNSCEYSDDHENNDINLDYISIDSQIYNNINFNSYQNETEKQFWQKILEKSKLKEDPLGKSPKIDSLSNVSSLVKFNPKKKVREISNLDKKEVHFEKLKIRNITNKKEQLFDAPWECHQI
ncbi:hypothetical protein TRFO_28359 [Tritrichomonas foetus]|uniref:WASH1 WAHD domain-containing protein n=1 Tax=Tritrichomonas foetus TaxID=1144522 RepID=A0A1J4K389_9EUKA|nr:hypothetical protein TRFO_28359 [Tritrichomonas foetus]|eukprot:OHT04190.1 hypothetical protein TRFO_28359 [Tritrichomonas foetus]